MFVHATGMRMESNPAALNAFMSCCVVTGCPHNVSYFVGSAVTPKEIWPYASMVLLKLMPLPMSLTSSTELRSLRTPPAVYGDFAAEDLPPVEAQLVATRAVHARSASL